MTGEPELAEAELGALELAERGEPVPWLRLTHEQRLRLFDLINCPRSSRPWLTPRGRDALFLARGRRQ